MKEAANWGGLWCFYSLTAVGCGTVFDVLGVLRSDLGTGPCWTLRALVRTYSLVGTYPSGTVTFAAHSIIC